MDTINLLQNRHELQQDNAKLAAKQNSTYKVKRDTTEYISENNDNQKQSVNDKLREDFKNFKNWLKN